MEEKKNLEVNVEDLGPVKKKVTVTVAAETVKKALDSAYRALKSQAVVQGFRKGAVPLNILKSRYGDKVTEDVTTKIVEMTFPQALSENNLMPLQQPKVDILTEELDGEKPFAYAMTFDVPPEVDVTGYKDLDIETRPVEVTEKDMEEGLDRVRQSCGDFAEVDRPAKEGDLVVVDFTATMDGKPVEGGATSDFSFVIGRTAPLPGMNEAVTGLSKDENRKSDMEIPENYSNQDLAGKTAQFDITVKAVKELKLPELDDELAKDLNCKDLEDLKTRVRDDLQRVKEQNERERIKNEAMDKLLEKHPIEVPESMMNRYMAMIMNRVVDNMKSGQGDLEDVNLPPDQLKQKYEPVAERHAKEDLILSNIAAKEDLEATTEEVEGAVRHLAESRGEKFEDLMGRIERDGNLGIIRNGIKHEKVLNLIMESIEKSG